MNVLVYKHCGNIRFGNRKETNGGNTEIHVVIKLLREAGHTVSVLSIDKYEEDSIGHIDKFYKWDHMQTALGLADAVLCFNGVLNAFGGQLSEETLFSYRILNLVKVPFIYAVTDTAIPLGELKSWIVGAQAKGKYIELLPDAYDFDPKKIFCLTQVYDLEAMKKLWNTPVNQFGAYAHFPFEMTVLFRKELKMEVKQKPDVDLIYFGNARGGKRDKKFHKFYCNHQGLRVDVYGNGWDFEKLHKKKLHVGAAPNYHGKCEMYELHSHINNSLAHCYISDPKNEGTIWTTRFYEAIMNRCILFIDYSNDPDHQRFADDFFYVKDSEELGRKVLMLKNDPVLRRSKLGDQFAAMSGHINTAGKFPFALNFYLNQAKDYNATYLQRV